MKKNNRLVYLLIVLLVIWNVILTTIIVNKSEENVDNQTNVYETNVTGFSTDLTKVIDECKSSVVVVETNEALASGFIYAVDDSSIYVVSTCHNISEEASINVVFASGASYDASLVGKDIYADIAIIKVETNIKAVPLKIGNSDLLKDGEFLTCIGTPKDIQYAYSNELAVVSSKLRTITNSIVFDSEQYEYYTNVIQLSANVKEGYSGSPIINMAGEVQGLITMKDNGTVFALPINEIKMIADSIISDNAYTKIHFGFKGLLVNGLEGYEKNQLNIPLDVNYGYYISNVRPASLASSMGLRSGDIILSINESSINTYSDLLTIEYTQADTFSLDVVRNDENITLVGSIND